VNNIYVGHQSPETMIYEGLQLDCEDVYEGCENMYADLTKRRWNMKTLIILLQFDPYRY
jgi:hypothetical protein